MGGDFGPEVIVAGAKRAGEEHGVPVLLVGDPDRLGDIGSIPVKPASEVIEMGAEPASSVRRMKDSSIVRAAEAVRDGEASSLLSAGNTGAAMAASLLRMGRIKGVSRPAIAVPFPVPDSSPTTVLDCGANADCQPEWLVQFAMMGTAYAKTRFDLASPTVGILSIGEEAGKGNTLVKEAGHLLETTDWHKACGANYVGNVEGRDVMNGSVDVIVTDGFTGNVLLKSLEAGFAVFESVVRDRLAKDEDLAPAAEAIEPVLARFDAGRTGAAMLLGTRGLTLISHGSSSAQVISNAICTADELVDIGLVDRLRQVVTPI